MCGICGFTGRSDDDVLKRMAVILEHRGPDEEGFFNNGRINLGFRRLSIVDIEGGRQPVHNEDESIWSVFNGEIYNFENLRKMLVQKGHKLYTSHSDSEVFVHLYEEYGLDFVNMLNGMFALALWDDKEEKLILIRDRMGVKPLFYALTGNELVFASEIKAILNHPSYRRQINFEALYHYFSLKNVPAPLTAFQDIYSLLPGELITFKKGSLQKERYWKIKFDERPDCDSHCIEGKILELLEDSVRLRMNCDVPFGAYLSGGVDSSVIVALMSKFHDQPIKTFSLGYADNFQNKADDLHFARKVSKAFNTEHYEYIMSHKEILEDIDEVIKAFDQPFSGTISTFFLSKLISKHVKVALSGDGADELFGSYLSHRLAQPMFYFSQLRYKYEQGLLSEDEKKLLTPYDKNIDYLLQVHDRSGGDPTKWRYALLVHNQQDKAELFSPEFKNNLGQADTYLWLKSYFDLGTTKDPLNQILEVEWNSQFPDQVLAFVDFLSMAHSVEVRSPFLDYRLVEFVATIPGSMKISNGNVKDLLKRTVRHLLPEGIIERPKEGFVLPVFDWMMGHLKGYMSEVLSPERLNRHNFFNQETVKTLLGKYYQGDKALSAKLWNLMMFQIWWEGYFYNA